MFHSVNPLGSKPWTSKGRTCPVGTQAHRSPRRSSKDSIQEEATLLEWEDQLLCATRGNCEGAAEGEGQVTQTSQLFQEVLSVSLVLESEI